MLVIQVTLLIKIVLLQLGFVEVNSDEEDEKQTISVLQVTK